MSEVELETVSTRLIELRKPGETFRDTIVRILDGAEDRKIVDEFMERDDDEDDCDLDDDADDRDDSEADMEEDDEDADSDDDDDSATEQATSKDVSEFLDYLFETIPAGCELVFRRTEPDPRDICTTCGTPPVSRSRRRELADLSAGNMDLIGQA